MNYLLDTHTLIWFLEDNKILPSRTRDVIEDNDNTILVSIVALWEIAIKASLGKLTLSQSLEDIIIELDSLGIDLLPIGIEAVKQVRKIPFHHRDPFDRVMICQGQVNNYTIIIRDPAFGEYAVKIYW